MKPIFCPMCGKQMIFKGIDETRHVEFICGNLACNLFYITFVLGITTEKDARRAWNKSLIGRLRKEYKKYRKDGWMISLLLVLKDFFGGNDDRPSD